MGTVYVIAPSTPFRVSPALAGEIIATLTRGDKLESVSEGQAGYDLVAVLVNAEWRLGFVNQGDVAPHPPDDPAAASSAVQRMFPPDIIEAAQKSNAKWKIPASVTLAQWALESGYGKAMAAGSNNPFGIKAVGDQDFVLAGTVEEKNGVKYNTQQKFRRFASLDEAFDLHGQLLAQSHYYAAARAMLPDAKQFATALTGVYSPDKSYGSTLIKLIDQFNLTQFDQV
jgi:flagellum-specific peptidoglycan hydrolase FlgJ